MKMTSSEMCPSGGLKGLRVDSHSLGPSFSLETTHLPRTLASLKRRTAKNGSGRRNGESDRVEWNTPLLTNWVWVKHWYPTWNPGTWKKGLKPAPWVWLILTPYLGYLPHSFPGSFFLENLRKPDRETDPVFG